MICPLCASDHSALVHSGVRDYEHGLPGVTDFSRCAECGLVFQNPQPSLEALHASYPHDYRPHLGSGWVQRLQALQSYRRVAAYAPWLPTDRRAAIADLGCGNGQFLKALTRAGYRNVLGVDREPRMARELGALHFLASELEPDFALPDRYALIVMNNVIEHMRSPQTVLARCRDFLAPGGAIVMLTPNSDAISHRLFGRYWSGLHAPRHTQIFNRRSLVRLAEALAVEIDIRDVVDPAAWAISFQNRLHPGGVAAGTTWYALASLPVWYPLALAERGGALAVRLR